MLSRVDTNLSGVLKSVVRFGGVDPDLPIRQYLYVRILGRSFNTALLYSLGSGKRLRHPLPREWRYVLIDQGVRVDNFMCAVLWYAYSFMYWAYGTLEGLKSIYRLLKRKPFLGKYVFFHDLRHVNISSNPDCNNIINWYLKWNNGNVSFQNICHTAKNTSDFKLRDVNVIQTDGLPQLKKIILLKYAVYFLCLSIKSFIGIFYRPVSGFFLGEMLKLKRVELACGSDLAEDYLFNNSDMIYRPIWTYLAESRGSRVFLYFYSTNVDYFYDTQVKGSEFKNIASVTSPRHLMSWPHYLVWDEHHADSLKGIVQGDPIIENVGVIFFASQEAKIDVLENSFSVFDVTSPHPELYFSYGMSVEYYVPSIAIQFLSDIQEALSDINLNMLHKTKRSTPNVHILYNQYTQLLTKKNNYYQIDPNIDATQLIQKTKATISMPFTSTAVIARFEGRPSIYYDASGMLKKTDEAAHGIPMLSNVDELKEWLIDICNDTL